MRSNSSLRLGAVLSVACLTFACTVRAPSTPDPNGDAGLPSSDAAAPDAARAPDAAPYFTPEERFASACVRWRYWSEGDSAACEECRSSSCFAVALRAEAHASECPGEFECVQDTCYADGTASSIMCDCVLPCMTVRVCRELWIEAMECVAEHCSEACGELPPD